MNRSGKTAVHDQELRIDAYRFEGIAQSFPNHFHPYYVIGLVERGRRRLSCRGQGYAICGGDILLFHPGDSHACVQDGGEPLDYRGLHLPREVMLDVTQEVTGRRELPCFSHSVIQDQEAARCLRSLHQLVMAKAPGFEREERLFLLLSLLLRRYGRPYGAGIPECRQDVERACAFLQAHYAQTIHLDQVCRASGLSKSTLLRAFTRCKGITPHCYLENLRIEAAKGFLEQGIPPKEAALLSGFSDQSHLSRSFSRFLGLPPGAYRDMFQENGKREKEHDHPHGI